LNRDRISENRRCYRQQDAIRIANERWLKGDTKSYQNAIEDHPWRDIHKKYKRSMND